jgi:uracil-DNA glycosylase
MLESSAAPNPSTPPPILALHLLGDYFQALADRGEKRISLSAPARAALRDLVSQHWRADSPQTSISEPQPKTAAVTSPVPKAPVEPPPTIRRIGLPLEERIAKLAALKSAAATHAPARALNSLRETMVFAVGNPMARLMFVGEAPGSEEEIQQEPFVGPAGELLTRMIVAMGMKREDVYITNICKFRPKLPDQGTKNRKPDANEMAACVTFVQQEIEIVQPEVIVALGATAVEGLLDMSNVAVGRVRAKFHDYQGIPTMITYHPSYLLHNTALSERRKVWEDLLKVMEKLNLPINDRQRGFFLPKGS